MLCGGIEEVAGLDCVGFDYPAFGFVAFERGKLEFVEEVAFGFHREAVVFAFGEVAVGAPLDEIHALKDVVAMYELGFDTSHEMFAVHGVEVVETDAVVFVVDEQVAELQQQDERRVAEGVGVDFLDEGELAVVFEQIFKVFTGGVGVHLVVIDHLEDVVHFVKKLLACEAAAVARSEGLVFLEGFDDVDWHTVRNASRRLAADYHVATNKLINVVAVANDTGIATSDIIGQIAEADAIVVAVVDKEGEHDALLLGEVEPTANMTYRFACFFIKIKREL